MCFNEVEESKKKIVIELLINAHSALFDALQLARARLLPSKTKQNIKQKKQIRLFCCCYCCYSILFFFLLRDLFLHRISHKIKREKRSLRRVGVVSC